MKPAVRIPLEEGAIERGAIQKPDELGPLVDFIKSRREPKTVLEIGSAKGGTLWLWCRLASLDALICSVDLPNGKFGGGYGPELVPVLQSYRNPDQRLSLIRGDSHDPAIRNAVLRTFDGRQLDLLFIDGDHTLEGVTRDWEDYSPMVKPGGLILFHDIVDHSHGAFCDCQVKPLWDRLKGDYEHYEFIGSGDAWGGIGVIVKD